MKRRDLFCVLALACTPAWNAAAAEPFVAIDREAARKLTDARAHALPTIVALWSSDCSHCKVGLGMFAAMARADARLRLITVAVEPLSAELAVPLDRLGVPGARYAYGPDSPEALAHALDPDWHGELPRTLFFDGRGGRTALSGVVNQATARRALKAGR